MILRRAAFLSSALLLIAVAGLADDREWRTAAEREKLTPAEIEQLAQDKMLVSRHTCPQIFAPYVYPDPPVFITSDSILNAYHVLFEESILKLEQVNRVRLGEILPMVWKNLQSVDQDIQGKPELVAGAKTRAQIIVGAALRLLGNETTHADAQISRQIETEVQRITEASEQGKPEWLGPADEGFVAIDYSRFKPRGFYKQLETLEGYFRAVSWLQSIPFRVDKDEELLAILMLGNCVAKDRFGADDARRQEVETYFQCFEQLLGDRDDWDVLTAAREVPGPLRLNLAAGDLEKVRRSLQEKAKRSAHAARINDQIAYPNGQLSLRIISAYRTPDAILFQKTTDPSDRPMPNGLEVCAALGSPFATANLDETGRLRVQAALSESPNLLAGKSLYCDYLRCLSLLLDAPAKGAPAFMSAEPWQIKSCQASLAGWAQLRHAWALQAKNTMVSPSKESLPRYIGFVEPEPVFFRQMAALAKEMGTFVQRAEVDQTESSSTLAELLQLQRFLEKKVAQGENLNARERENDFFRHDMLETLRQRKLISGSLSGPAAPVLEEVRSLIAKLRKGEVAVDSLKHGHSCEGPVIPLWKKLEALCTEISVLADKQLRGEICDNQDEELLLGYGRRLAPILFHDGHPSASARDDVPRIIDVFSNPNSQEYLEVAVGRPRLFYVLYPVPEGEVLCRGAVLPYYEFRHSQRLDDDEWKDLLDSNQCPSQPAWINRSAAVPTHVGQIQFGRLVAAMAIGLAAISILVVSIAVAARRRRGAL